MLLLWVLLAQTGCGSDPVCPLGTVGSSCELSGELGSRPDVPTGAGRASDGSVAIDSEDAVDGQAVDDTEIHTLDGSADGTEDMDALSDDAGASADGAGDQTPNVDTSDDDGDLPGDGARVWERRLRPPGSRRDASPPTQRRA